MITFPRSCRLWLIPLSALLFPIAIAWAAPLPRVAPLANQAFLLDAEHAQWLKPGSELTPVTPLLLPLADADGFADTQRLAPVPPASGSLAWSLAVATPGRYRIALEYRHDKSGNAFELRTGTQCLPGAVPGTRGTQALIELGELTLSAGPQTLELRSTSALDNTFMSVSALYLYPAEQPPLTRPQLRAAIAAHKPRKLPAELRLPAIFSDHLVLQRDQPVPIWGRAQPGAQVTVTFRNQTRSAQSDPTGRWRVQLNPLTAGGPFELTITDGNKTKRLTDVLVGEVWFGSGQSNMEVSVKFLPKFATPAAPYECDADTKQFIESGVHPQIRISAVTRDHGNNPGWSLLTADNCLDAPALLTSAAILLRQKLQVPVGIIVRAESSSPSGIWLSRDAVEGDAEIQRQLQVYAATDYPQLLADYPAKVQAWEDAAAKAKADGKTVPVKPNAPALSGHFPFHSYAYSAGQFEYYGANYTSRIAPVAGYAVRGLVWDQGENHTGIAGADQSAVMPALLRCWRAAWGRPDLPFFYVRKNQHPETLPAALAALGHTVQIDNRGLGQINHPPDKAAYARRLVEQMERTVYNKK